MSEAGSFASLAGVAALAERCNTDPRFREWGRGFTGEVALRCGSDECWLRLEGGRAIAVGTGPVDAPIRIGGSAEDWEPILAGQQGGIHRAWRHQRLRFDGDGVALMRHYKMVWRLGDLLVREGGRHAVPV